MFVVPVHLDPDLTSGKIDGILDKVPKPVNDLGSTVDDRLWTDIIEIENDLGPCPSIGHPDHVVDLYIPACTYTQVALNTRVEVHPHRRMTGVRRMASSGRCGRMWTRAG